MVKMAHVTFNDKVECLQYSQSPTMLPQTQPSSESSTNSLEKTDSAILRVGRTPLNYDRQYLKTLRDTPLSQVCPDIVKLGIESVQGWVRKDLLRNTQPPTSNRPIAKRSVFAKPSNPYQNASRRTLVPWAGADTRNYNNPTNSAGDEIFTALQPIGHGSSRLNSQPRPIHNRNLLPEYAQRYDSKQLSDSHEMQTATEHSDAEPEWYRAGPTSRNDFIELHGFDGPGKYENDENKGNTSGSADANSSGGPCSGASSQSSPPARSTPAKATPGNMKNDSQRMNRGPIGRANNWSNRQPVGAHLLNDFFKNFATSQNKAAYPGIVPVVRVEDVESNLFYERLKFNQMVAQMQAQRNLPPKEPKPTASQILLEIDKILRTTTDPIFKRPEVRPLVKSIFDAILPPFNIMKLMKNPLNEPHSRETVNAVINLIDRATVMATNALRGEYKVHTPPTEAELKAHSEAIYQEAILKKRIENLARMSTDLLKMSVRNATSPHQFGQFAGRSFPQIQNMQQNVWPQQNFGWLPNLSQSDATAPNQQSDTRSPTLRENNLNRWFSPTLLNKARTGELPPIQILDALRSEDLESSIRTQLFKENDDKM